MICLGGILAAAATARLPYLATRSIWYDEASSWQTASFAWPEIWHSLRFNVHLPEYYYLLKAWMLVWGDSIVALRLFSVLCGLFTVVGAYLFAAAIYPLTVLSPLPDVPSVDGSANPSPNKNEAVQFGLWVAAATALNGFQVLASIEARMYALGTALCLFSAWLGLKCLAPEAGWAAWVGYGVATAAFLHAHHFALFTVAAGALPMIGRVVMLLRHNDRRAGRRLLVRCLVTWVAVGLAWLPAGFLLLHQYGRVRQEYWIGPFQIEMVPRTIIDFILPLDHAFDLRLGPAVVLAAEAALLLAALLAWKSGWGERVLLWQMVLPMVACAALSLKTPIWEGRYFRFCQLFWIVAAMTAAWRVAPRSAAGRNLAAGAIVGLSAAATGLFWSVRDIPDRPGMAGAMQELAARRVPGEAVLASGVLEYFPAKYYAAHEPRLGRAAIRLLPPEAAGLWDQHLVQESDLAPWPELERGLPTGLWLIGVPPKRLRALLQQDGLWPVDVRKYEFDYGSPQWTVHLWHYVRP